MATTFLIRTTRKTGEAAIFARVQRPESKIDIKLTTGLKTDIVAWNNSKDSLNKRGNFRKKEKALWDKLDIIEQTLDEASKDGKLTKDNAREIIDSIVYKEARENLRRKDESNSFMDYYSDFCERAMRGEATKIGKGSGKELSKRSVINYIQGYNWLREYQEKALNGRGISFDSIDKAFFDAYVQYLRTRTLERGKFKGQIGCSQNTISMRVAELKTVLRRACEVDEKSTNEVFKNKSIVVADTEVFSIALSQKELDAIRSADLSKLPKCYDEARDLFLVGVYTAQRVSDYGSIKPEDIKTFDVDIISEERGRKVVKTVKKNFITIRQQKTGATVEIPVKRELQAILDKYDNKLPHMLPQKLNEHIKEVGRLAGITNPEKVPSVRGGKETVTIVPRYCLIHSHTARRTGATMMFNAGMDIYDIMRVTGHRSIDNLKRYVKAGEGEAALRIAAKYHYFD